MLILKLAGEGGTKRSLWPKFYYYQLRLGFGTKVAVRVTSAWTSKTKAGDATSHRSRQNYGVSWWRRKISGSEYQRSVQVKPDSALTLVPGAAHINLLFDTYSPLASLDK